MISVAPAIMGIVLRAHGAVASHGRRRRRPVVQEVLGHLPAAVSTAVHVPLGVTLFGWSILLTVAPVRARGATRPGSARCPAISRPA